VVRVPGLLEQGLNGKRFGRQAWVPPVGSRRRRPAVAQWRQIVERRSTGESELRAWLELKLALAPQQPKEFWE